MTRWLLLIVSAALLGACATHRETGSTAPDAQLIADAFHLGFPVYEMARVRHEHLQRVRASGRGDINRFSHRRTLSDHTDRGVTTPNNDTLYSAAWLDLTGGPVILDVPAAGSRYASLALMNMFTDNFAYSGTRAAGGRAERLYIAGPGWRGRAPAGTRLVRAPTNDVWALSRILVDGPADLPAGNALQDGLRVQALGPATEFQVRPVLRPTPEQFLNIVNAALGRAPVPAEHARRVGRLAAVGIRPGAANVWSNLPPETRTLWERSWAALNQGLRGGLDRYVTKHQGWSYPNPGLGNFGQNDAYRAAIALEGLAALDRQEAMYMFTRTTGDGRVLDGASGTYRLRVPADVPVQAFWSLTMYEDVDDRLFFVDNPIRRYSIGNRTPGLVRNPDGTLDIVMSRTRPEGPLAANWLPAPAGPFRLGFRAYLPGEPFRSGAFRLPGIEAER